MKERASIYVPAIGKVTIVVLLRNLLVRYLGTPKLCPTDEISQRLIENREGAKQAAQDEKNHEAS